ncbi:hypothetical protein [Photobacterium kishitanii]|uniref:Uncharacterized protein n=1 Tax=Photobacterium kishitanii TaxID=318456 RepID=A0A2T3KMG2_9GAMM|nr:hypothetical protein [Photobacterium kishitanii]PSV00990.1 hypothetical protein C9J27_02900 [Photobacterium kishitanii]
MENRYKTFTDIGLFNGFLIPPLESTPTNTGTIFQLKHVESGALFQNGQWEDHREHFLNLLIGIDEKDHDLSRDELKEFSLELCNIFKTLQIDGTEQKVDNCMLKAVNEHIEQYDFACELSSAVSFMAYRDSHRFGDLPKRVVAAVRSIEAVFAYYLWQCCMQRYLDPSVLDDSGLGFNGLDFSKRAHMSAFKQKMLNDVDYEKHEKDGKPFPIFDIL